MLGIEPYPNPKVSHLRVGFVRVSHRAYTTTTDENRHRILTYFLIRYIDIDIDLNRTNIFFRIGIK